MQNKPNMTDGSLALEKRQPKIITIAPSQPNAEMIRVAAYIRVSSASEDQLNSFAAQNRYYTDLIAQNKNWELVDIYMDEGITGTSAVIRKGFQQMLGDCRRGMIDRILVKSISRFARNTTDCLTAIRELRSLGVRVTFEKEGLDTQKMSSEMLTAIHATFAQSESESISSNMRWSCQKRMKDGTFISGSTPLGYSLVDRGLKTNQDIHLVRMIFDKFLSGENSNKIADELTELGVPSPTGSPRWHSPSILYILRNEKYMGDTLLQKNYSTASFPHIHRKNQGEQPKYYIANTQEAIISEEDFRKVQELLDRRSELRQSRHHGPQAFTRRIICGNCGSPFRKRICSGTCYWSCIKHLRDKQECTISQIPEAQIEAAFLALYWKLKQNGAAILQELLQNLLSVQSRKMLWSQDIIQLNRDISDLCSQRSLLTTLKQQGIVDPDIYISQLNELKVQIDTAKRQRSSLLDQENDQSMNLTREMIDSLEDGPELLTEFDSDLFTDLIEQIIVDSKDRVRFRLRNGLELTENIERTSR